MKPRLSYSEEMSELNKDHEKFSVNPSLTDLNYNSLIANSTLPWKYRTPDQSPKKKIVKLNLRKNSEFDLSRSLKNFYKSQKRGVLAGFERKNQTLGSCKKITNEPERYKFPPRDTESSLKRIIAFSTNQENFKIIENENKEYRKILKSQAKLLKHQDIMIKNLEREILRMKKKSQNEKIFFKEKLKFEIMSDGFKKNKLAKKTSMKKNGLVVVMKIFQKKFEILKNNFVKKTSKLISQIKKAENSLTKLSKNIKILNEKNYTSILNLKRERQELRMTQKELKQVKSKVIQLENQIETKQRDFQLLQEESIKILTKWDQKRLKLSEENSHYRILVQDKNFQLEQIQEEKGKLTFKTFLAFIEIERLNLLRNNLKFSNSQKFFDSEEGTQKNLFDYSHDESEMNLLSTMRNFNIEEKNPFLYALED